MEEKKKIKVFVSMPFRGRTLNQIMFIIRDIEVKLECSVLSNYEVKCVCNFDYEAPKTGIKKIHQLSNAIKLMADCDGFVMLVKSYERKPTKLGCKLEEKIWKAYGDPDKIYYMIDDYNKWI